MSPKIKDRFRTTKRDREMVAFAARHRGVEGRQVAERFDMHVSNAHRRLGGLVQLGLLDHRRVLHGQPGVYIATRAGLEMVGMDLPPARVDLRSYEHDVELVWLAIELEREFSADALVTERELRSRDMSVARAAQRDGVRPKPRYSVSSGSVGLHFPDLAIEGGAPNGGLLAIELERTSKGAARRRAIIGAYQTGVHVEQVRYYGTPETLRAIQRTIDELRANQFDRVIDLRPWKSRATAAALAIAGSGVLPAGALASSAHHHHRRHHHRRHAHAHHVAATHVPGQALFDGLSHAAPSFGGAGIATALALVLAMGRSRLRFTWAAPLGALAIGVAYLASPLPLAGAAGAALGTICAGAALFHWEREDEKKGGPARRRRRAKVGPVQWTRRALQRRRIAAGPHGGIDLQGPRQWPRPWRRSGPRLALGETLVGRRPAWLRFDQLVKHLLILGATGGGKSNSLLQVATRAIRAGAGAIVVDMKADPGLAERLQAEAGYWGRPFYLFRIEGGGQLYNPLRRGDATARRDRLVASQTFSEDYYRGLFSTHAKTVFDALAAAGREPTLAALAEWWDVPDLQAAVRAIPDDEARERVSTYCERLPRGQAEHVASLKTRLLELTDTAAGELLRSGTSAADQIDLLDVLTRRAVVVFSINADSYPGAGSTLGNLVLQDLIGVVGELRQARQQVASVVGIDEFGALSGEQVGRLLSTGRDVGVPVILAGQDLAQLRRVSPHFEAEVKANISGLIAHRQSEPDSAEQIARICGTEEVTTETEQFSRYGGLKSADARPGSATGVGTRTLQRDFRIGPDQIKDLDNGHAAVRLWNPASVDLVRIHRCETAAELAASARVTVADLLRLAENARLCLATGDGNV